MLTSRALPLQRGLAALCAILIALYAAVVIVYPDKFFAEDSYFYLQVAWNFAHGLGSTFNGFMPTNGYHPLWMLACAAVFKFFSTKAAGVHGIGVLIGALNALMIYVVTRVLRQAGAAAWWAAAIVLIPFFFLTQLGTEAPLSALLLALTALTAHRFALQPSGRTAFLAHTCAALAVLSRLDNIFIVSLVWLALLIADSPTRALRRRLQLLCVPVYVVLWGAYLASNEAFFHILKPISGMLKTTGQEHHKLFDNFSPHTAWVALAIILPCFFYIALRRRDLFFHVVETPFFLGVLCHGSYIAFFMSYETRWSWYYVSWYLLASILLARTVSDILQRIDSVSLETLCGYSAMLLLAVLWIKSGLHYIHVQDTGHSPEFQQAVYQRAGIHSALAYDYPGRFGFYSDVRIIPLDGLMGDINFQRQLATEGIARYAAEHHIDGFMGPAIPISDASERSLCETIHNGSTQFDCIRTGQDQWDVIRVHVFSRIPHASAGTLALHDADIVWTQPGTVSVWRLHADGASILPTVGIVPH